MRYTGATRQSSPPQIGSAVFPYPSPQAPLSQAIQGVETFPNVLPDDFNRSSLGPNWTVDPDANAYQIPVIVGGILFVGTAPSEAYWNPQQLPADQQASVQLAVANTISEQFWLVLRGTSMGLVAHNNYIFNLQLTSGPPGPFTATLTIYRSNANTYTNLGSASTTIAVGDTYTAKAIGARLSVEINGVETFALTDPAPLTGPGYVGIGINDTDQTLGFDNFDASAAAGNVNNQLAASDTLSTVAPAAPAATATRARAVADTLSTVAPAAPAATATRARAVADTLSTVAPGVPAVLAAYTRAVADTLSTVAPAAPSALKSFGRTAADTLSSVAPGVPAATAAYQRPPADTLTGGLASTVAFTAAYARAAADMLSALSPGAPSALKSLPRAVADTLSTVAPGAPTRLLAAARQIVDTVSAFAGAAAAGRAYTRAAADTFVAAADTVTLIRAYGRQVSDTIRSGGDAVTVAVVPGAAQVPGTITITDTQASLATLTTPQGVTVTITDTGGGSAALNGAQGATAALGDPVGAGGLTIRDGP